MMSSFILICFFSMLCISSPPDRYFRKDLLISITSNNSCCKFSEYIFRSTKPSSIPICDKISLRFASSVVFIKYVTCFMSLSCVFFKTATLSVIFNISDFIDLFSDFKASFSLVRFPLRISNLSTVSLVSTIIFLLTKSGCSIKVSIFDARRRRFVLILAVKLRELLISSIFNVQSFGLSIIFPDFSSFDLIGRVK